MAKSFKPFRKRKMYSKLYVEICNIAYYTQTKDKNIINAYSAIKAFVDCLDLWKSQLLQKELHYFECLKSLNNISDQKSEQYCNLLEKLKSEFTSHRFQDFQASENTFSLFANPMSTDIWSADLNLQKR